MKYVCTKSNCTYDDNEPYTFQVPPEVWEQHNMAVLFCPYCGGELKEKDAEQNIGMETEVVF